MYRKLEKPFVEADADQAWPAMRDACVHANSDMRDGVCVMSDMRDVRHA